jgi:hypothetical protein
MSIEEAEDVRHKKLARWRLILKCMNGKGLMGDG